jgi:hypothetical protein
MAKRRKNLLRKLRVDEISVVDSAANPGAVVLLRKQRDTAFKATLDRLAGRYKATVDTGALEALAGLISPEGFRSRCDEAREVFDLGVAVAKAEALAERRKKPSLESPGLAEREADRRYRDNASPGMRTPSDPDTGLSEGGFDLRTTGYSTGDKDEPDAEPDDDDDDDQDDDDAYQRLSRKAKKLAKRTGVSEAVAFSTIYEDPRYSELVAATKRPVVRVEKSAQDAFAELMALAEQAYAAGKYPTVAVAFEKMLCAGDPMRRESVKRARGTT